ncbi:uncharacterized protein L203_101297 [Cryptococcus depauperatus CBS 7841]|uniref:RWD domain-containing protein n=1 Tax=Cryptococcus depauperatus CBS 7841 TaxID=1295531 RepID=A0AAJ8JPP2_9TREE
MADYKAILEEEFEVLESIFPDEHEKLSENSLSIRVEPEEPNASNPLTLNLVFVFPENYPDVIPQMSFEPISEEDGELREEEVQKVLTELQVIAEESIGMAMTFTLASAAKEALRVVIEERLRREKEEDDRRTREYEEAEAARTRGTPLTPSAFQNWRKAFTSELTAKREKAENERIKGLNSKEREDYNKRKARPTGKQLFESGKLLVTGDEALYEEGTEEVDMRKYTREEREKEKRREEEEQEKARRGMVEGDSEDE